MKKFFLVLLMIGSLGAANYSNALLEMYANIIPKIILMDYGFQERLSDSSEVVITVLYDENNRQEAQKVTELIETKYRRGIKGIPVRVKPRSYAEYLRHPNKATVVFLFDVDNAMLERAIRTARRENALLVAMNNAYLEKGVHVSLEIGKQVRPYLNLPALKQDNITFRPALMRIAKLFNG